MFQIHLGKHLLSNTKTAITSTRSAIRLEETNKRKDNNDKRGPFDFISYGELKLKVLRTTRNFVCST